MHFTSIKYQLSKPKSWNFHSVHQLNHKLSSSAQLFTTLPLRVLIMSISCSSKNKTEFRDIHFLNGKQEKFEKREKEENNEESSRKNKKRLSLIFLFPIHYLFYFEKMRRGGSLDLDGWLRGIKCIIRDNFQFLPVPPIPNVRARGKKLRNKLLRKGDMIFFWEKIFQCTCFIATWSV